jgi:hypothetical protein
MSTERTVVSGFVENGVVVPCGNAALLEGTTAEIKYAAEWSAELRAEFADWERADDVAWAMIDEWEHEE